MLEGFLRGFARGIRENREQVGRVILAVSLIAFFGFLLGGCVWLMECAGGSTMSGMPSPDWCPFD